jgi:hypothetical protein
MQYAFSTGFVKPDFVRYSECQRQQVYIVNAFPPRAEGCLPRQSAGNEQTTHAIRVFTCGDGLWERRII